jgi:hypothetical protein
MEHKYELNKSKVSSEGYGCPGFSSAAGAATFVGEVTFSAHVYVQSIEVKESSEESPSLSSALLVLASLTYKTNLRQKISTRSTLIVPFSHKGSKRASQESYKVAEMASVCLGISHRMFLLEYFESFNRNCLCR